MAFHVLTFCITFLLLSPLFQSYSSKSCHLCDEDMDSCMQRRRYPFQAFICVERKKGCMRRCSMLDNRSKFDRKNGKDDVEVYILGGYWNSDQEVDNEITLRR